MKVVTTCNIAKWLCINNIHIYLQSSKTLDTVQLPWSWRKQTLDIQANTETEVWYFRYVSWASITEPQFWWDWMSRVFSACFLLNSLRLLLASRYQVWSWEISGLGILKKDYQRGGMIIQRKWEKFTWNLQKLQMFLPRQKRLSENLESSLAFLKGDYNMFIGGIFKERSIVSCTYGNWSCLTDTFKLGGSTTT